MHAPVKVKQRVRFKNSVGLKLLSVIFSVYFVFTVAITISQLAMEYRYIRDRILDNLVNIGSTISQSLSTALWNYDISQISATLEGAGSIAELVGAKIYSENDELQAVIGRFPDEKNKNITSEVIYVGDYQVNKISANRSLSFDIFYEYVLPLVYLNPVDATPRHVGYALLYSNRSNVLSEVKYTFILIVINSFTKTLVLWFIIFYVTRAIIIRPLRELTEATRTLNRDGVSGKFEIDVNEESLQRRVSRGDEISMLIEDFFGMRSSIFNKIKMIEQQNESLEQRVHDRTSEVQSASNELSRLAHVDNLTNLPNRRAFYLKLEEVIKKPVNNLAVVCIDLSKFKAINDTFGHDAGDAALVEVAKRLKGVIRDSDTVARLGGDEFALIINGLVSESAESRLMSIAKEANGSFEYGGNSIDIRLNMGAALHPFHGNTVTELYKFADVAMYHAKSESLSVVLFTKELHSAHVRREVIVNELKLALENDEFTLYYQPLLSARDGSVIGVEALLRWHNKKLGEVYPDEFIGIAEVSGQMAGITDWVVATAIKELQEWDLEIGLSINMSETLMSDSEFPVRVKRIIDQFEYPIGNITLEITETAMMRDQDQAMDILNQLKSFGLKLSIDDFGTGYSSFSYLTKLPVNELKIDRSFLLNLNTGDDQLRRNSRIVIVSIVELCHQLNLDVVAEGVENSALCMEVTDLGVDSLQGYLFARPAPIAEFHYWLVQRHFSQFFLTAVQG